MSTWCLSIKNSYLQLDVSYSDERRILNSVIRYDAKLVHGGRITIETSSSVYEYIDIYGLKNCGL